MRDRPNAHRREGLYHRKVTQPFAAVFVLALVGVVWGATIRVAAAQTPPASSVRAASPVDIASPANDAVRSARPSQHAQPSPREPGEAREPKDWQARDWAMACMSCHNTAAPVTAGRTALPALEGRSVASLMASLRAMRDGQQPATLMPQLLKGYRDDELQRIAAYFAAQPVAGASRAARTASGASTASDTSAASSVSPSSPSMPASPESNTSPAVRANAPR